MRSALLLVSLAGACAPTNPGPDVIARADFVAACARVRACVADAMLAPSATACAAAPAVERAPLTDAFRCVDAAGGDCAAILACLAGPAPVATCGPGDAPACLDATHVQSCFAGTTFTATCGAAEVCVAADQASGTAGCGEKACGVSFVPVCDGERIVRCNAGVLVHEDCPAGSTCAPADLGAAQCIGTGAECSGDTCDGSTLVACLGGREARRDCAADDAAGTCGAGGNGSPACVGTGSACDASFVDRCNGARLEYCQDGSVAGLDCTGLGLGACALGPPARCGGGS